MDAPALPNLPPSRPLLHWRTFFTTAIVVLPALLLFKYATRPNVNRASSLYHSLPSSSGPPSISDDYLTLRIKADAYHNARLREYLQTLDYKEGEHLQVERGLNHGPILLEWGDTGRPYPLGWMVHVPGDLILNALNWNSAVTQAVPLTNGRGKVVITPEVLKALAQRKEKLLALFSAPPEQVQPGPGRLGPDFDPLLTEVQARKFGLAYLCAETPLYCGDDNCGGPSKTPSMLAPAGTRVYGVSGPRLRARVGEQTRIRLNPSATVSYLVASDRVSDARCSFQVTE